MVAPRERIWCDQFRKKHEEKDWRTKRKFTNENSAERHTSEKGPKFDHLSVRRCLLTISHFDKECRRSNQRRKPLMRWNARSKWQNESESAQPCVCAPTRAGKHALWACLPLLGKRAAKARVTRQGQTRKLHNILELDLPAFASLRLRLHLPTLNFLDPPSSLPQPVIVHSALHFLCLTQTPNWRESCWESYWEFTTRASE